MSQFIQYGDQGVNLIVTITDSDGSTSFDISTASVMEIWLGPPTGSAKKKTATFVTDGTDGQIQYATASDDIDEVGLWDVQAYWVVTGSERHSNIATLDVRQNVE